MLTIAIGITMAVLDSAVINIALPVMARELNETAAATVWVVNAYQIAIVVALLPLSALGERIGYARVYRVGVVIFTAASLACALSDTLPALVASRTLQGLGAAGIMSVNPALVRYTYPDRMLGRGLGLNALVVSFAAAIGPTLASGILSLGPWPWLFAINVPFGILNAALAWHVLPASDRSPRPFDWTSAVLNALVLGLFFVGIGEVSHGQGPIWMGLLALALAVPAGMLLVRRQVHADAPLIPFDLLRIPVFALSITASVCSFAAYMLAFVSLPFYFQQLGRSTVETGLLMTPWPVALGIVAPVAGRLSDRFPASWLGGIGMIVLAAGLASLALMPADPDALDVVWRMALGGAGFALFQSPNNRIMLSAAPRSRAGAAGGMLATARLLGQTGGASLTAILFATVPGIAEPICLWAGVALALLAAAASLARAR